MIDCLILGDSIAVGTHQFATECRALAKGGINSWQWNRQNKDQPLDSKTVIISLGSNDHAGIHTEAELESLRNRVHADRVFWILPAIKPSIQDIVRNLAAKRGDVVLPINRLQPDGIHPSWAGYKDIVARTKQ